MGTVDAGIVWCLYGGETEDLACFGTVVESRAGCHVSRNVVDVVVACRRYVGTDIALSVRLDDDVPGISIKILRTRGF